MNTKRYAVECYTTGEWCVVDSRTDRIVRNGRLADLFIRFTDRTEAQKLANAYNEKPMEARK